jgi:bifunctional non-homologous end joining protein LigD
MTRTRSVARRTGRLGRCARNIPLRAAARVPRRGASRTRYTQPVTDRLDAYRTKRDLAVTSEPDDRPDPAPDDGGVPAGDASTDAPRFVVQEHHARRLHWDLRLERDGVLVSWAVPRGIPPDPRENHLAVHVEDHPLSYIDFEGEIPSGEYGAGSVHVWDHGTYETHKFRDDEVIVTFRGERLRGKYALFKTRGEDWMVHRMDPPEDPDREPMPGELRPMLASLSPKLPTDDAAFAHEIKWDGVRALAFCSGGRVRLANRTGRDVTGRYPEVRGLGEALGSRAVVLDGEVVAFDEQGRPSFQRLQSRMHLASESAVRRRAREVPVHYIAFDVLYLDGRSTLDLPYEGRRELLAGLELSGPAWQAPAHHRGDGQALLEASRAQGLEGIVAKRLDSPYEPGRRSSAWLKVKNHRSESLVVGGWMPGTGGRRGRIGSLLVGFRDTPGGALRYAGRVGTGFTERELARLGELLEPLAREDSPFEGRRPPREARFVEPRLVAEVAFAEWTHAHTLRQPSYKGLRDEIEAHDVVIDPEAPGA